jgi:thiol-disulfide isomerase/thioredoxin
MDEQTTDTPAAEANRIAPPEPRLSRKAAWIAMGSVAVALGLLWAASDLSHSHRRTRISRPSVQPAKPTRRKSVGKVAPLDYTVKDMNGTDVHLASFKGKIILLNFWATWCHPCKEEIPDLVTLQKQYKDDIVVLGFSMTTSRRNSRRTRKSSR